MKEVEVKTVTKKITEEIVLSKSCDCCGKKIAGKHSEYDSDITSFDIEFGYGSRFDTSLWKLDICDDCLEKWTSSFIHKIKKVDRY